jgi:hypothetical protein
MDASATYDLAVVDPDAPAALIPIDRMPAHATGSSRMVHVLGGAWDAASGTLLDPGVRHVVYLKDGAVYRVTLDKGAGTPGAVRLSTESQADTGLFVAAQNRDGSDALIGYLATRQPGQPSVPRYVRLSTPASSVPLAAPVFPGDPIYGHASGWTLDADSGAIVSLLWSNVMASGGGRLFRTDADLAGAANIAVFTDLPAAPWAGAGVANGGHLARGHFFLAGGALRRYDHATGDIRLVFPNVTGTLGGVFDDGHAYLRLTTPAGARLVRASDTPDSSGVAIADAAFIGDTDTSFKQTRDYLVFVTNSGADAVSVRKTDGAQVTLPNAGGLLFTWHVPGAVGILDGNTAGNRVYYSYSGAGNVVGSVLADGTDRRELPGLATTIAALPPAVAPHRLVHANIGWALPFTRFLVNNGNEKRWVDAATGEVVASVGSVPAALVNAGASLPYYGHVIGRVGAFGHAAGNRADAWMVSGQPGSLVRLTSNIP